MRKILLLSLLVLVVRGAMAQAPVIVDNPRDWMVCNDGYAIIIATYSGTPTTILWEQSADGGQTWSAVPNTSNYRAFEYSIGGWSRANLQIGSTVGIDDYQFRVTLSNPVTGNIQSCVTVDATVQSYNGIA